MTSMDEILARKKPNERSVDILLNSSLKGEIAALEKELNRVARNTRRSLSDTSPDQIQTQIDALYDRAHDETVSFTFRDIGRKRYDELVAAHPPTQEQKDDYKAQDGPGNLTFNPDTFPPALISACAIDPEISLAQATLICDTWSEGDIQELFLCAIAVCKEKTSIPFGKSGSAVMSDSDLNSTTALSGESPTPSS